MVSGPMKVKDGITNAGKSISKGLTDSSKIIATGLIQGSTVIATGNVVGAAVNGAIGVAGLIFTRDTDIGPHNCDNINANRSISDSSTNLFQTFRDVLWRETYQNKNITDSIYLFTLQSNLSDITTCVCLAHEVGFLSKYQNIYVKDIDTLVKECEKNEVEDMQTTRHMFLLVNVSHHIDTINMSNRDTTYIYGLKQYDTSKEKQVNVITLNHLDLNYNSQEISNCYNLIDINCQSISQWKINTYVKIDLQEREQEVKEIVNLHGTDAVIQNTTTSIKTEYKDASKATWSEWGKGVGKKLVGGVMEGGIGAGIGVSISALVLASVSSAALLSAPVSAPIAGGTAIFVKAWTALLTVGGVSTGIENANYEEIVINNSKINSLYESRCGYKRIKS